MTGRQETARGAPVRALGERTKAAAAGLAVYAVTAPVLLSVLAAAAPLPYGTLALGASLAGPGLAAMVVGWRGLGATAQDLAERGDGEPAQAVWRLFAAALGLAYLAVAARLGLGGAALLPLVAIDVGAGLAAWLLLLHVMVAPGETPARRGAALLADAGFVSLFLAVGGRLAAPFLAAYFASSVGFGVTYGAGALIAAAGLSVLGFAAVFAASPYWHAMPEAAAGIALSLVLLPALVGALLRRLAAARRSAAHAEAASARLVAVMGHELRAPLDALIGMGGLLARTGLEAEQRGMLAAMQLAGRTLLDLTNDLLDMARIEAGTLTPKIESFVLYELLGGALAMLRPQAEAKGLSLALTVDPALPLAYRGMPLQLRQALLNLLGNAIKFSPRGRITLAASLVERSGDTARLRLAVRDDGVGIPAAARERIFDAFAQGEASVPGRFGGSGLGLAIATDLLAPMGGSIAVDSAPGAGSTFVIEVPLAVDPQAAVRPPDLLGRRAVLATADASLADVLAALLKAWRGAVQACAAGEEALAAVMAERGALRRPILVLDGRDDPLAALSLAHRAAGLVPPPAILFIAPAKGSAAIAGLAAPQLGAVVEAPVGESVLAAALLAVLAGEPHLPAAAAAPPPAEAPEAEPHGLRILVAEDGAAGREVIKAMLAGAGHRVELVADGAAALGTLERGGIDVALLDLKMPGLSGDAVAKLYRLRHPDAPPFVALTADDDAATAQICHDAGMDAVLTKPVEPAQLFAVLAALETRRAERAGESAPAVTPISAHPRFLADEEAVVHERTVESLRTLGGSDFVGEVVESFRADATRLVGHLRGAVARADRDAFAEAAHSLKSGAANVGGVRLCQTLDALKDATEKDLRQAGALYLEKIETELARLEAGLDQITKAQRARP